MTQFDPFSLVVPRPQTVRERWRQVLQAEMVSPMGVGFYGPDDLEEVLDILGDDEEPVAGIILDGYLSGASPEEVVNALSPLQLAGATAVCNLVAGIVGKLKSAGIGLFITAICTIVASALNSGTTPNGSPAAAQKPEDCGAGTVYSKVYGRCVQPNTSQPCSDQHGFVGPDGICLLCPAGTYYASPDLGCQPGCGPGYTLNEKWGCVRQSFNHPCSLPGGGKGIVGFEFGGTGCTPDGCDEGYRYDFMTESCVKDPTAPPPPTSYTPPPTSKPAPGITGAPPPRVAEETSSSSMKWVLGLGLATAAGLGVYYFASRPSSPLPNDGESG